MVAPVMLVPRPRQKWRDPAVPSPPPPDPLLPRRRSRSCRRPPLASPLASLGSPLGSTTPTPCLASAWASSRSLRVGQRPQAQLLQSASPRPWSSESVQSVRIRSTMLVRLLHGFVLLPNRISVAGTGNAMI